MAIVLKFVYAKAYWSITVTVEGMATDSSLVHDIKALLLMVESELGRIVAESKELQPWNALLPSVMSVLGSVIEMSDVNQNELEPIEVMPSGKEMEVMLESRNAWLSVCVKVEGKWTVCSAVMYAKAPCARNVTPSGSDTLVMAVQPANAHAGT
jgi:hypothetical protein